MAVSTKTLTPTNQVVTIPDMTEKPNASVLTDGISKEADAINALNSKLTNEAGTVTPNTTYVDNVSIICVRNGNIVIVSGVFKAKADIPTDTEIIELSFTSNNRYNVSLDTVDNKNFFAYINGTKIKTQTAIIPANTWCYLNLIYLKA